MDDPNDPVTHVTICDTEINIKTEVESDVDPLEGCDINQESCYVKNEHVKNESKHSQRSHGKIEKKHKCDVCEKLFAKAQTLKNHILAKHVKAKICRHALKDYRTKY